MATATVIRETPKPEPPPIKSVTLELSLAEAQVLRNVIACLNGSGPERRLTLDIGNALSRAGIDFQSPLRGNGYTGNLTLSR